jgi:predicted MFS family arabinose efflux permease
MEKSAERDSSFNQGLAVLAVGLGVALGVAAIGHAGLSTKAELGGWLILTGLVVAFIGGFMMLKASCRKKVK